ncbi:MAG: VWA domain-containing protein [Alphaproteobacteria bacterium]
MADTPMRNRGVPWPVWAGLGAVLLGLAGLVGWRLVDEPAQAADAETAVAPAPETVALAEPPAATPDPEREKALVQLAALNDARAQGTALADEVSRLRWALLDQRRQCVVDEPPPPVEPQVAEAEPPGEPPVAPEPPAVEEPAAEEPAPSEPVVVAAVEVEPEPVAVAVAPPPPPPPAPGRPALVPAREAPPPPPPPPPPAEPVQVADAPVQVATTTVPAPQPQALPGCPAPRPPEEAPEVVFVLDASESMMIPYGAPAGIDEQLQSMARGGLMGGQQAEAMFQQLISQSGAKRIDRAKQAMIGVIQSTPADVDMGLITFHDCGDVRNFGYYDSGARGALTNRIAGTRVGRGTPLADSMTAAGNLIRGGRSASDPAYMVVVTDGNDSCGGNPCAVAQRLAAIYPGLIINVIDLSGTANLQCVAGATGGQLVRPEGSGGLTDMVRRAAGQPDVPAHCLQGQ